MILESLLALSLSTGGDLTTSEMGRERGFHERNPLCATTGKCIAYTGAWMGIGTLVTHKVEKKWGEMAGYLSLGLFCALPLGAATHNAIVLWKGRRK